METYGAVEGLGALGDRTRRSIVLLLAERPLAVRELAAALPVSRPAVSQHLKVLKDAGLVAEQAAGTRRIYRLNAAGLSALRDQLETFWDRALAAYQDVTEHPRGGEMSLADNTVVRREIVVAAPIAQAFATFTGRFGDFKPPEHNLLASPITRTTFDTRVGGHIYDVAEDGSECRWARILAFEPPNRVVFSWDISPNWRLEADPSHASEVEVRFVAETPERTRVQLEHRHLDRHGEGWEGVREGVAGDAGWPLYLARFADLLAPVH